MAGTIRVKFAQLLAAKKKREKRQISLYEVARATGVKWATIKRWYRGEDIGRFDAPIVVALIEYFSEGGPPLLVCDLLEYVPEEPVRIRRRRRYSLEAFG